MEEQKKELAQDFIHYGFYCYDRKLKEQNTFNVQYCPFYKHLPKGKSYITGFCLLNSEFIEDDCKMCGVNEITDEEMKEIGMGDL